MTTTAIPVTPAFNPDTHYLDLDTGLPAPKIPSTTENWENGTLGCDARYVRVASPEESAKLDKALGLIR